MSTLKDFFFKNHWEKLPESWRSSFSEMSPNELRWLIDSKQNIVRQVLPLTLLSFRSCTQVYSADRQRINDLDSMWKETFSCKGTFDKIHVQHLDENSPEQYKLNYEQSSERQKMNSKGDSECNLGSFKDKQTLCTTDIKPTNTPACRSVFSQPKVSLLSDDVTQNHNILDNSKTAVTAITENGALHYFYRKHVKPKKQHEIFYLSKVIQLLSSQIGCSHVVDVGGGLGHLSRLLSFGFGLKVTSVEASDGHAPKANKYDREIDREIKKKKNQTDLNMFDTSTSLPHHVTSMIYPNMTAEDFLDIIQSQGETEGNNEQNDTDSCPGNSSIKSQNSTMNTHTCQNLKHDNPDVIDCKIASKIAKLDSAKISELGSSNNTILDNFTGKDTAMMACTDNACDKLEGNVRNDSIDRDDCCMKTENISVSTSRCTSSDNPEDVNIDSHNSAQETNTCSKSKAGDDFILTGLHACGDLTPTFLRFFVNCYTAKGLASVGCCYMKLSDESHCRHSETEESLSLGYPMSRFIKSLPDHELSYMSRELACHFADTYSSRLKDNPPHLKIHSYRAALEWVANQLYPDFKRSTVQIPAKKTNKMDFESYVRLGLLKLGISPDLLTPDLLDSAKMMVERWKDVVAFYTLRLSLAPVIETLVLLDRMIFLHEHGLSSILMPIFDPNISPRNFVLVSWK